MEGDGPGVRGNPLKVLGILVFLIGFAVFAVESFATVQSAAYGPPDSSGVVCGFLIAAGGMVLLVIAGYTARSAAIPPPPPIQQPMVPAGLQGPVGLNCPACGAPAGEVDRFGVAA